MPIDNDKNVKISLLTAGRDPHYALGLASGLTPRPMHLDFIGNDAMQHSEFVQAENLAYYNLRGEQSEKTGIIKKVFRVVKYYTKLIVYAVKTKSPIFHILWHNKFLYFDMTLLCVFYRMLGKKIVYTAHNINIRKRDGKDNIINRYAHLFFYRLTDKIFVHTRLMKQMLIEEFCVTSDKIKVIRFGVNNAMPNTDLSSAQARERLNIGSGAKVILFFGNIAPYKGLEYLVGAIDYLKDALEEFHVIIAGQVKNCSAYWEGIEQKIKSKGFEEHISIHNYYIPDEDVEIYFKAADLIVLPYVYIYQTGVLFLSYQFGLPAICTDVGQLKDELQPGHEFLLCRPKHKEDIAGKIISYFNSDLFKNLSKNRGQIAQYTRENNSWETIGKIHYDVYKSLSDSHNFPKS